MHHIKNTGKKVVEILFGKDGRRIYRVSHKKVKLDHQKLRSVLIEIGKSFAQRWKEMAKSQAHGTVQSNNKEHDSYKLYRSDDYNGEEKNMWNDSKE